MSLAAALATTRANAQKTRLDEIWDAMGDDDRAALIDGLRDPDLSHTRLAKALTGIGHRISKSTIGEARANGWASNKETS